MLTFEFTAINMIQPEKNQYAYKMDGFDKEWRYIGSKREATYTNLSPGTYVFRVIASNNDGYWNEEGASITVIIKPPWWMTWWFRVLLVIIIIHLVAAIVIIRNRQLIRQKAKLTEKVKLRTKELRDKNQLLGEQAEYLNETNALLEERQEEIVAQSEKLQELNSTKDRFFSIIAHDLTSPFNTILGFTELFSMKADKMSNKEKVNIATTINDSAKKVYGLLDNLLKWSRSQTEGIKYTPIKIKIENIITETIQLYELRIQEKEIKLQIDNKEDLEVTADADMLKTVLRNLVGNAIKFSKRGGRLSISAIPDNKKAIISVSDTGVGMKPEMIDKLFDMKTSFSTQGTDGETGSGIGLILTRDFVERNKGRLSIDSTPGMGTTLKFTIPLA
jgi:signal transduction histidine kinase